MRDVLNEELVSHPGSPIERSRVGASIQNRIDVDKGRKCVDGILASVRRLGPLTVSKANVSFNQSMFDLV